ncbi:hypothetical protein NLJ89_g267 [Agrocybe chaxingu]|uniref:tRNA dimethylallyltransferase n=1 Tax=Agrocybe chaxingu TaxID=84603 RepID=A0A9W8N266_9AGAR|nr:hypothetical protein NLJ89_g267 [Agrocybe chaxingu]
MAASLRPIIAICGTTGVGKSKLAIELALHLNRMGQNLGCRGAKVINADAMQVYEGLDIITNKVPESERHGVAHMMMDFKQPGEQYVVGEWVEDTLNLIDELHNSHQLPIIVGGTSYWIQHLIFPNRLVPKEIVESSSSGTEITWPEPLAKAIATLPLELSSLLQNLSEDPPSAKMSPDDAFQLHTLLAALDPVMAQRWHWKDTRKVLRSLEILKETRKRPSDVVFEQSSAIQESQPRFRTLLFWLYTEPSVLRLRLDARVDDMISQGLLDEVKSLRDLATNGLTITSTSGASSKKIDYTIGIYQSIGYKEFCKYLEDPSDAAFREATERMKISTRQYAKRQISWIRNKLIPAVERANAEGVVVPFYLLDATTLEEWVRNVQNPAFDMMEGKLS